MDSSLQEGSSWDVLQRSYKSEDYLSVPIETASSAHTKLICMKPFPVWDVQHECVNFDKLNAWTHERALDMNNIPIHPETMGGWIDPETMSADAKYFLEQVHIYEERKEKEREEALRAKILGPGPDAHNCSCMAG